jgi:hypothetical protein
MLLVVALAQAMEAGGGLYGGYLVAPPSIGPGFMAGARLRYRSDKDLGLELAGGISPAGVDPRLEFLYFFKAASVFPLHITPFFALGPGLIIENKNTSWLFDAGGGIDVGLTGILELRMDLRLRAMGAEDAVIGSWFGLGLQFHTPRLV